MRHTVQLKSANIETESVKTELVISRSNEERLKKENFNNILQITALEANLKTQTETLNLTIQKNIADHTRESDVLK